MDPNRKSDRILSEWDAVAHTARRPASAPRRRGVLAGLGSGLGLAGAGLLAAGLVVAVAWMGGRISTGVGTLPSASASTASIVAPSVAPSPTSPSAASLAPATAAPTPKVPSATATPAEIGACASDALTARITAWEGAAGSRIGDVTVHNTATTACRLPSAPSIQLVDGSGRVLIDGKGAATGGTVRLAPGETVTTLVQASNYCGKPPTAPVRIAFDLGAGGRLLADPPSPTDDTVPPCNGPTVGATIQMQPWSRG
jgi:hypothetical protein